MIWALRYTNLGQHFIHWKNCILIQEIVCHNIWFWRQKLRVQSPTVPPGRRANLYSLGQVPGHPRENVKVNHFWIFCTWKTLKNWLDGTLMMRIKESALHYLLLSVPHHIVWISMQDIMSLEVSQTMAIHFQNYARLGALFLSYLDITIWDGRSSYLLGSTISLVPDPKKNL